MGAVPCAHFLEHISELNKYNVQERSANLKEKLLKNLKWILPIIALIAFFGAFIADLSDYEEISEGIYNDPESGQIIFITEDKNRTSDIFYRTKGFTITDTVTGETIRVSLENTNDCTKLPTKDLGNGRHRSTWTFSYEAIMRKVQEQYPGWAQRIVSNSAADIQFDAIIQVWKNGTKSGNIAPDGSTLTGTLYDKDNWDQLVKDYPELAGLKDDIKNHYDKLLEIMQGNWIDTDGDGVPDTFIPASSLPSTSPGPSGSPSPNPTPTPMPGSDEFVKKIGQIYDPYYATYNYDPTGRFVIGANYRYGADGTGGIPTDEDITNGYEAWKWYGGADIHRRKEVEHEWIFKGDVTLTVHLGTYYDVPRDPDDPSKGSDKVEATYDVVIPRKDTNGIVVRQARYWYLGKNVVEGLGGPWLYGLDSALTENEVFPGGKHHYIYPGKVDFNITCNGIDLSTVSDYDMQPNDDYHIDWAGAVRDPGETFIIDGLHGDCSVKDSLAARRAIASNLIAEAAESHIRPNEEIDVRNDEYTVEGHTYMSSDWYKYRDFHEEFGEENTAYDIADSDHEIVGDEENGRIPTDIANDDYPTTIQVTYEHLVFNDGLDDISGPDNFIKEGADKFGHDYRADNEPVRIHTPTVSAVEIIDPSTGQRYDLDDMPNQLMPAKYFKDGNGPINENADYQLLLDGTYTIRFTPETHLEHMGYDAADLTDSMYNKYCSFREVCFPFVVQVNGKIYTPDDEIYAKSDGRKKIAGYTEWIRLPDGADGKPDVEIEFYIPTWSQEKSDHVIQFRVAPINVIDHKKVDHIESGDTYGIVDETGIEVWDYDWNRLKNIADEHGDLTLYDYVSTYSFTVQLSGIIYDFQAVGIDDKDRFKGYRIQENGYEVTNGLGEISYFPFCPTKQEKCSGIKNRFGNSSVRFSFDGTLTNDWDERNTLPFSIGRSQSKYYEGSLVRGNTFAFTVKTIANLGDFGEVDVNLSGDATEDCVVIFPSFRYISMDGTEVNDDIEVYYNTFSQDGTKEMLFVRFGEPRDLSVKHEVKIADIRFNGSYFYNSGLYEPEKRKIITEDMLDLMNPNFAAENLSKWKYLHDDAEYTTNKANAFLKAYATVHHNPDYPETLYTSANRYLNKSTESYCLSEIVLNSRLRLLTGNVSQLKMNENNAGEDLQYLEDKLEDGSSYKVTPASCEAYGKDYWDLHRQSMQTWFGMYWIPNQLFVVDDVFEADADGDGVTETYDNLDDYINAKGYIETNDPIFKKTGYLVVNFQIYTKNNGEWHLAYKGGNTDMWDVEDQVDTVQVGDPDLPRKPLINIKVRHGDVAIIDLTRSIMDGYTTGFNRIN